MYSWIFEQRKEYYNKDIKTRTLKLYKLRKDKEVKFKYVIPYRRNSWLQIFDKIISFQNIIYTQDIWNQNKKLHSTKRPRQNLQYIKGITLLEIVDHLKKQKKNPKWIPSKSRFTTQRRQKIPSNSPTMGAKGL